jgi:hypothetical protein
MLQVAFSRSSAHRALVRRGPAAMLGTACHAVLEAVGAGALDDTPRAGWETKITSLWTSAVAAQAESASQSDIDSSLGPPNKWPYHNLRYAQVRRIALELAAARASATHGSTVGTHALLWIAAHPRESTELVEVPMVGFDGRLRGQADRIHIGPDGVRIDDYKSGAILDSSAGAEPAELKSDYRQQLLLYAALYHAQSGVWPNRARVVPLHGDPVEIMVDPAEAGESAEEALALLETYNRTAQHGDVVDLANPSAEACNSCAFRGTCEAYWLAAAPEWEPTESPSCEGEAASIEVLGDGSVLLRLRARAGTTGSADVRIRGLTPMQITPIRTTDQVRLVRLRRHSSDDSTEFWASAATEAWLLRSSSDC